MLLKPFIHVEVILATSAIHHIPVVNAHLLCLALVKVMLNSLVHPSMLKKNPPRCQKWKQQRTTSNCLNELAIRSLLYRLFFAVLKLVNYVFLGIVPMTVFLLLLRLSFCDLEVVFHASIIQVFSFFALFDLSEELSL